MGRLFSFFKRPGTLTALQAGQKGSHYSGGNIEGQMQSSAHVLDPLLLLSLEQLDLGGS